ncbi:hypothetical protein AB0B85_04730 [Micromonospora sp. NPDC049044]|uniref:hypothetical protein n=1 Tax=unclassified Micromonospora TaxID=2617518 RepID=UPI0033E0A9A7
MRTFRLAVSALTICVALSACGSGNAGGGTPTATPPATPTETQPVTSPTTTDPTTTAPSSTPSIVDPAPSSTPSIVDPAPSSTPSRPKPGGPSTPPGVRATTLSGVVRAGVEPKCVLLDGYLLLGGPRDVLTPGTRVEVTGRAEPGMMTTCQQGTPFVVSNANRS